MTDNLTTQHIQQMRKHKTMTVSPNKKFKPAELVEANRYKNALSCVLEFMDDMDESIQKIPLTDYTQHLIKGLDDSLIHADIDLVEIINILLIHMDIQSQINQKLSDLQKYIMPKYDKECNYPEDRKSRYDQDEIEEENEQNLEDGVQSFNAITQYN